MYQRSTVTMSMRELDRLKVIQAVVGGELRAGLAAERLSMSTRQIRRLAERYRLGGPVGLISRLRNRPCNRRLLELLVCLAETFETVDLPSWCQGDRPYRFVERKDKPADGKNEGHPSRAPPWSD